MRVTSFCAAALCLMLAVASPSLAHRVNIFAFVDGDAVQVECGFNRSQKVRQGTVEVLDAVTGAKLAQGLTDDNGVYRFPLTAANREAGHDLTIRIVAGEGHQNDWTVAAEELAAASDAPTVPTTSASATSNAETTPAAQLVSGSATASEALLAAPAGQCVSAAEVRHIVETALDAKLSPVKRMLAEQTEAEPGLRDIVGGIGWIFGLIGIAAYFRRRP